MYIVHCTLYVYLDQIALFIGRFILVFFLLDSRNINRTIRRLAVPVMDLKALQQCVTLARPHILVSA